MNRPWIVWLTALCCGLIVLGSIGMVTRITLDLETKVFVDDKKDERVRDAMWAMDYYVDSLLARENSREASDYAPLKTVFNKQVSAHKIQVKDKLSPLFNETPADVKLFWYIGLGEKVPVIDVASPQAPSWGLIKEVELSSESKENWQGSVSLQGKLVEVLNGTDDDDLALSNVLDTDSNLKKAKYLAFCAMAQNSSKKGTNLDAQTTHATMVSEVNSKNAEWPKSIKERNLKGSLQKKLRQESREKFQPKAKLKKPDYSAQEVNNSYNLQNQIYKESVNPYLGKFTSAQVSPFVASWLSDELMLIRKVKSGANEYIQGVWLNQDMVKEDLLEQAQVFLPNATLVPVLSSIDEKTLTYDQGDLLALSKLPWRLEVGEIPDTLNKITPMRLILIISWICVILAILAVIIMFRGIMKLSERRASFVSSVSHELRTPLTTFKLYSEMLATGMVRDEAKKQKYLDTLISESDRLTHMVENVLSFSQLEKGKKKALQEFALGRVVESLQRNFEMRLAEDGMLFENLISKEMSMTKVRADATSVDQILTNLVDNAAKYGQSSDGGGIVTLSAEISAKFLSIKVQDRGAGIPKGARGRLFKEFHKSDVEAAHSKPGVGLGLALCQRLAKSMGGDVLVSSSHGESQGTCVELRLKLA